MYQSNDKVCTKIVRSRFRAIVDPRYIEPELKKYPPFIGGCKYLNKRYHVVINFLMVLLLGFNSTSFHDTGDFSDSCNFVV